MMKRVVALLLCLATLVLCLAGCSHGDEDKGPYIRMYLTQPIYDLDPLAAFDNEDALQIVSLLFEGLFEADEDGTPKKSLVDDYEYIVDKDEGKYTLTLTLKTTNWSDGVPVSANDVQYAFSRLFRTEVSSRAVAMLCDIKNAREIIAGNASEDHLGVSVVDSTTVEIEFEGPVDIDAFLLVLCSPALYPVREDILTTNSDWAKKSSTIVCSGPFMIRSMKPDEKDGFVLERNSYYYRNRSKDDLDKYVTPYRIVMDCVTSPAEQFKLYNTGEAGTIYYFGHIPLSVRTDSTYADVLKKVKVSDAASTHVYYLNETALINGETLFASTTVRQALSLAIDRDAIASALVYARPADGIVPYTILNRTDRSAEFRKKAESYLATTANVEEAARLLSEAGIRPSNYSFSITVAAYDEDHMEAASMVMAAWKALGFNVTLNALGATETVELTDDEKLVGTDVWDDAYRTALDTGDFEVIALDLVATAPTAFSYLAPFALSFSGNATNMDTTVNPNYDLTPHITGYNSEEYNTKIEEAFAADKAKTEAEKLHEAEGILMRDLPAIPIFYNQDVELASSKLGKIESSFFCNAIFTKTKFSSYWKVALRDGFVEEKKDDEE